MQSAYGARFDREMASTESDWLSRLPAAIGEREWQLQEGRADVRIGTGRLRMTWRVVRPRAIAAVKLPRLLVAFEFTQVEADARHEFMTRFDLYMQRGGG